MSTARFDELIHAPTRPAIVSLLAAAHLSQPQHGRPPAFEQHVAALQQIIARSQQDAAAGLEVRAAE